MTGTINVTVIYAPALQPYHEPHAPGTETLSTLKANALSAFGLTEGPIPGGGSRAYKLFHGRDELTDLTKTLADVAGHAAGLELKLVEYIVQGTDR